MQMKDPFVEKAISGMKLLTMIDWVNESSEVLDGGIASVDLPIIALPPVQRSAVWRPKQVVDLWDSLIRGLPIGIFYLVRRDKGRNKLTTWKDEAVEKNLPGYDLLDGQQRIRALLLGGVSSRKEERCLWVDLGDKKAAPRPVLHITSKGQPFGYDPETGNKLDIDQRRDARKRLEKNGGIQCKDETGTLRPAYDHDLFAGEVVQGGLRISQPPLPVKASEHTFRLSDLLCAWRKSATGEERIDALRSVTGKGPNTEALIRLHEGFDRIDKAAMALLLVDTDQDGLLKLFDRIGAGGTPLSVEERLYSIYKHHWPDIRNAVNQIHHDVGRVLPPTKIAATAIRIAYARYKDDGNSTPDVATFSKIVTDEKNFRNSLEQLIPSHRANTTTTLRDSFQTIKTLLC